MYVCTVFDWERTTQNYIECEKDSERERKKEKEREREKERVSEGDRMCLCVWERETGIDVERCKCQFLHLEWNFSPNKLFTLNVLHKSCSFFKTLKPPCHSYRKASTNYSLLEFSISNSKQNEHTTKMPRCRDAVVISFAHEPEDLWFESLLRFYFCSSSNNILFAWLRNFHHICVYLLENYLKQSLSRYSQYYNFY
jgi:hypothetical protein